MSKAPKWLKEYCKRRIGGDKGLKKLRNLYDSGARIDNIMREFNLASPQCIYVLVEAKRRRHKKHTKITDDVKKMIIDLRREGGTIISIAEKTGVSIGSVHRVLKEAGLAGARKR